MAGLRGAGSVDGRGFAGCTLNVPGGQVIAMAGDTCNVSGNYATTGDGQIAGQATGLERADHRPQLGHGLLLDRKHGYFFVDSTGVLSPMPYRRFRAARSRLAAGR